MKRLKNLDNKMKLSIISSVSLLLLVIFASSYAYFTSSMSGQSRATSRLGKYNWTTSAYIRPSVVNPSYGYTNLVDRFSATNIG